MYDGKCMVMKYDIMGKVLGKEVDVVVFMEIEGGVFCFMVFFEFSVWLYVC